MKITNFYNWSEDFTGSVDLSAKTITIQPSTCYSWFTFASISSSTEPVVGIIADDGTITFKDFTAWYGEYYYINSGTTCVMTKK